MKTIINSLLAIFIFGIIATGFAQKQENQSRILLQSADSKISTQTLSQSADVMSKRLKGYSNAKFEISTIPAEKQIQILFDGNSDQKLAEKLVTQKGEIGFYETYFYKGMKEILKGDTTLFTLLHAKAPRDSTAAIVCSTEAGKKTADQYLNSVNTVSKCRFAWSNLFEGPEICLYALKTENGNGVVLKGTDIESFQFGNDSVWHLNYINFNCKPAAVPVWADITKRNINKAIAMVLDGYVIYAPVVRNEIPGGRSSITGDFTPDQLKFIAAIGNSGELPVPFEVVK